MIPKKFIGWVTINRACNLACKWCYAQNAKAENMRLKTFNKVLNLFEELPLDTVILIGGEPTLHRFFIDMVLRIAMSGISPVVFTNGVQFKDRRFLDETLDAGLKGVITSLKAPSNGSYQDLTGKPAFDDVMTAVRNINELRPQGVFNKFIVTVCRDAMPYFGELVDVIADANVDSTTFSFEHPYLKDGRFMDADMASMAEMSDFVMGVYSKLERSGIPFVIKMSLPFCWFPSEFITMLAERQQILSGCQIYDGSGIIIDVNGGILPCNSFVNHPIGHIDGCQTKEKFYSWRKEAYVENFYRKVGSCPDERCVSCEKWSKCGAGCPINWLCEGANLKMLPRATGVENERTV